MTEGEQVTMEISPVPTDRRYPIMFNRIERVADSDDETIVSNLSDISEVSTDTPILEERSIVSYSPEKIEDISISRDEFNIQYRKNTYRRIIASYPNQTATATRLVETFRNRSKVIQLVIGPTQSGKTGCMIEFIRKFVNEEFIPLENIYIITGLSSREWLSQCRQRFPGCLKEQIFHNSQMQKFKNAVKNKQNVLVIVDEAHMACLKKQTMNTIFKDLNWKLDYMMENDIKLVQFSATPDGIIFALNQPKWPTKHYHVHIMGAGHGYYGARQMMRRRKLKQINNMCGRNSRGDWEADPEVVYSNIREVLQDVLTFDEPKYVIFRVLGGYQDFYEENVRHTVSTLPAELQEKFDTENINHYSMDGNVDNITRFLSIKPQRHTFIFIKEKLKCAQTLEFIEHDNDGTIVTKTHNIKHHIGVMVERWSKAIEGGKGHDSFYIQGCLGRLCGYEIHDVICYTNLGSVTKYETLMESNFDPEVLADIRWNSNSTKSTQRGTNCKKTVNSAEERIDGDWEEPTEERGLDEPIIVRFTNQDQVKAYYTNTLMPIFGGRGPNKMIPRPDGFYENTIRNVTKVFTATEVFSERRWGLKAGKNNYRCRACYTDINDKNTLQFWIIHVKI